MKPLIKDLEWSNGKAVTPFTEYDVMPDGDKWKVKYFNKFDDEPVKDATGHITKEAAMKWANDNHKEKMTPWLNTDPLTDTVNWFKEAKPEPTDKDALVQQGCHFEEVVEHLISIGVESEDLCDLSNDLKSNTSLQTDDAIANYMDTIDQLELLDALADQIVTAVGVAYMMGFDIIGALTEVNASNWSKFVDGKAVTDENGKIIKGSNYFKPELDKFVGGSDE